MHLAQLPGVKADTPGSRAEFDRLKRHGYHWINFQSVNRGRPDIDYSAAIASAKAAGLSAGVWGVAYSTADFYEFGKALGRTAVRQGAEHVTADLEECLKNTRGTGWVRDHLIKGLREVGWGGPVHLNTLAAPSDPRFYDFGYDVESFLATGGGIFAQCYVGLHPGYHPACARHYYVDRLGVPATRFNATISLRRHDRSAYHPEGLLLTPAEWKAILLNPGDPAWMAKLQMPAEWKPMLERATFQRNLSLYLLSDVDPAGGDAGLGQLDYFTLQGGEPLPQPQPEPEPEPQPEPTPTKTTYQIGQEIRAEMIALANAMDEVWRNDGKSQAVIDAQRITVARHILETGAEWGDVRAEIKRLLGLA